MFVERSTFERVGEGAYEGSFEASWFQGRAIYGGLVSAVFVRALEDAVDDSERAIRSLNVAFCGPGQQEVPAVVRTRIDRAGKSVTHASARLEQGGATIATALAVFGRGRPGEPRVERHPDPPEVARPEDIRVPPRGAGEAVFAQHFDFRPAAGPLPFAGTDRPRVCGWGRLAEPVPPDPAMLAAVLDMWWPAALSAVDAPCPVATIDLSYHFLAPLDGYTPDAFYLYDGHTPTLRDGYAEELGCLWGPDGKLIARVRQMVAVFPKGAGPAKAG